MTIQEFLRFLEEVRDEFEWTLEPAIDRSRERRRHVRFHLRCTPRHGDPLVLDPLRAACYAKSGKLVEPGAWSEVADALGLELTATAALVAAANDRTWNGTGAQREPTERLRSIRRQMLDAVGIAEHECAGEKGRMRDSAVAASDTAE